jgi:diguanylate cyclase (GGDEF)-like protein
MYDWLNRLLDWLDRLPKAASFALALLLIAVVGFGDYSTGHELSFSIFYVVPVAVAAFSLSKRIALAVAFLCALSWFAADLATGHTYSHYLIPYWNAAIRLAFFSITALAVFVYKASLQAERERARTDSLTGLANARGFYETAALELERMCRFKRSASLAYLDCDDFKQVNDTWGHLVGSQVLRVIGETMKAHLRSYDLPARIGGDEFVVLLPETDSAQTEIALEKLRLRLLTAMKERGWPVTLSIGVVTVSPAGDEPLLIDELIKQADSLMYEAKNSGKDRIVLRDAR